VLRAEIEQEEHRLGELQTRAMDLRIDLAIFLSEYEQRIAPWQKELQLVQNQLETVRGFATVHEKGSFDDFISLKEEYRRAWRPTSADKTVNGEDFALPDISGVGRSDDEATIRKLYRQLALLVHPDLAPNDASRERRTDLMSRINDAYAARDGATLERLADTLERLTSPPRSANGDQEIALPPIEDEIEEARTRLQAVQLANLSIEGQVFDVEWCDAMKLKREVDAAREKGLDLLGEIVADLWGRLKDADRQLSELTGNPPVHRRSGQPSLGGS
jgi:hypothetical protein